MAMNLQSDRFSRDTSAPLIVSLSEISMAKHRVYRGVGVCKVLSSEDLLVLEPLTSLGTPPRIEIPPERVDLMTRETATPVEAQEILDLLAKAPEPLSRSFWARRRRVYEEAAKEGVLSEIARHLRDLLGKKNPSHAERTLRDRFRSMVADELSVALDLPRPKMLDLMEQARRASLNNAP